MDTSATPLNFHRSTYADAAALADWAMLPVEHWPEEWFSYNEKQYPRLPVVSLPPPSGEPTCLPDRSSSRAPLLRMTENQLSTLLWQSTHDVSNQTSLRADWHRPYPSAGGRLGCEIYVLARAVDALRPGVYSYNVKGHSLSQVRDGLAGSIVHMIFGMEWVADTCAVIAITASLDRLDVKYGPRAYRYAFLEAGGLAQTLSLAATNERIGTCVLGGFADVALAQLLLCTPNSEFAAVAVALTSNEEV